MKQNMPITRNTGKKCHCKGNIVEIFVEKYGESNGVIGPGYHCSSWIQSAGFGCKKCGQKYGPPVFNPTPPTEQIKFEFTLSEAKLQRKITVNDVPPMVIHQDVRCKDLSFLPEHLKKVSKGKIMEVKVTMKNGEVPEALKNLKVGTKIYIVHSHGIVHNRIDFCDIVLSRNKKSKVYVISLNCLTK